MEQNFRLGPVLVEPSRCRLSAGSRSVVIEPRVMDLLSALAAHDGEVVSRETLEATAWPAVHVGYHALTRAVYEARKALQEIAPDSVRIETIPRRGYRVCVIPVGPVAPTLMAPMTNRPHREWLWSRAACAAGGALALGLLMHAFDAHGSPLHFVGAAMLVAGTVCWIGLGASASRGSGPPVRSGGP